MGRTLDEQATADRLTRVTRQAGDVLGSSARALQWLETPNTALAGEKPGAAASSSVEGLGRVATVLGRIDHGIGF